MSIKVNQRLPDVVEMIYGSNEWLQVMLVHKTENVLQILIRWIIRVKPGLIYAVWYVTQRRKVLECKHIYQEYR